MPGKKRKRKLSSQSVMGVRRIRKQNQEEMIKIQDALNAYTHSGPAASSSAPVPKPRRMTTRFSLKENSIVQDADLDPETNNEASSLLPSPMLSEAFENISRTRGQHVLREELKRLQCRDSASEEAIRRAEHEIILSSQCQSEFAMLYSRTQTGSIGKSPYVVLDDSNECETCGSDSSMRIDEVSSELVCDDCGYTKPFVEYTLGNLSITEPREFYSCSYKRLNHLLDFLQHLQAKEEAPVPKNLLSDAHDRLMKASNGSLDLLKSKAPKRYVLDQISQCIKGSKFPKRFGARTVQIMKEVLKVDVPKLLHGEVRQIKSKFRYLAMLYFKFAPQERRNFLSYPFTAWVLIDLVHPGHPLLDYIQLLKNLPKLKIQENTVRRIFKHLGWTFRSIPWKAIRMSRIDESWKSMSASSTSPSFSSSYSAQEGGTRAVRVSGIKR